MAGVVVVDELEDNMTTHDAHHLQVGSGTWPEVIDQHRKRLVDVEPGLQPTCREVTWQCGEEDCRRGSVGRP